MEDDNRINVYSEEWSHTYFLLNPLTELTELTENMDYVNMNFSTIISCILVKEVSS
jgi:hypothetical protein